MAQSKTDWSMIKEYLLSDQCNDVHKIVFYRSAMITDWTGVRREVTNLMSFDEASMIIESVRFINKNRIRGKEK